MTTHVDLSAPELNSDAVLKLVMEHAAKRSANNFLFKVSADTYETHRKKSHSKGVPVSQKEADELNAFLKRDFSPSDYMIEKNVQCSNCKRALTFYDVFQTGRKRHSDEYVARILRADAHHMQVLKEGQELEVDCSGCGTFNSVESAYGTSQY